MRFEIARATKDLDLGTRLKIAGTVAEQNWRNPFNQIAAECSLKTDFDGALNIILAYWNKLSSFKNVGIPDSNENSPNRTKNFCQE